MLGAFKALSWPASLLRIHLVFVHFFQLGSLFPRGQSLGISSQTVESGPKREDVGAFGGLPR